MGVFKVSGDDMILDVDYAEFYIPEFYFDKTALYAYDYVTKIQALCIFNIHYFEKKNGNGVMKLLAIPSYMDLPVYDSEKRNVSLAGNTQPCRVLKYVKGQKVFNAYIVKDAKSVMAFTTMMLGGKIPSTTPYQSLLPIWWNCFNFNSVHPGVNSTVIEGIISAICRDSKNPEKQFNKRIGKNPDTDPNDYLMASVREACRYTSTFTAMTFEDMDSMITSSVNKSIHNKTESYSPLEEVIKY